VRVLVVNAGSSTIKLAVIDERDALLDQRELETPCGEGVVAAALEELGDVDAVGHRIVHGGERFLEACVVDRGVLKELAALTELAPLHQPPALEAISMVSAALPGVPQVACFDTAFHATLAPAARTYALPQAWRERWPIRRYGFHGLSHGWVARHAPELAGGGGRIVSCHLGAGASLCAIADGRSIDTTMGFTPLEGLVMATRSGSVDPGLVLWLADRMTNEEVSRGLERESGLLGLAGSGDMRELLERARGGEERATLAIAVYCHRLRALIASMVAALEGIDVLAFTGGVGENASAIRGQVVHGLAFLGVELDAAANAAANGDANISGAGASVQTVVVRAREDLEIARQTRAVLGR